MVETQQEMVALINNEISGISDPIVVTAIKKLLVPPVAHHRKWCYGAPGETILCWSILEHKGFYTGIVYSDVGFGPKSPWGLVSLSVLEIGDDSGWFKGIERAFYDSFAVSRLKIWRVMKKDDRGIFKK